MDERKAMGKQAGYIPTRALHLNTARLREMATLCNHDEYSAQWFINTTAGAAAVPIAILLGGLREACGLRVEARSVQNVLIRILDV